ncbi:hypothetical protein JCM24511_09991 [Saitozyma sp. JCM 24511]|nr:hypothetical protein JCM24511_09991 [Saitozyma sp. JCM 24511]
MSGFLKTHPPSTVSHWIATNRGPSSLHNHGREDPMPERADIVIVGAGIAGALLAYHLAHPEDAKSSAFRGKRIVVLEGGEVASSATGRNGGHFAPATFLSYPRLIRPLSEGGAGLSKGQAVDILCQEWDNYVRNRAVIKKHGLESKVDLWEGKAMTVYGSEEELKSATDAYDQWREAMRDNGIKDDYSDNKFYKDRDEAVKVSRVKSAVGCSTRNAGSVHPHKLTTELLKLALASDHNAVSLFTSTPVLSLSEPSGGDGVELKTSRGNVTAPTVILCTNAHTPHLFPKGHPLNTFIYPIRTQMGLVTPPTTFAGVKSLETSYGFPRGYCATSAGGIVVGVTPNDYIGQGIGSPEDFVCNSDDTALVGKVCTDYLEQFMESTMVGWGEQAIGEGLTRTWTGVMGYTIDRLPLIGPVPGRPGLFLSAGYNGHGMSTTHTCARALAHLLETGSWDQEFPEAYMLTPQRLERKLPDGGYVRLITGKVVPPSAKA